MHVSLHLQERAWVRYFTYIPNLRWLKLDYVNLDLEEKLNERPMLYIARKYT